MAKLKNVLLMALSFALVAALAIGGTVAYLTSTDSAVNVMTVGNVKIQQIEQERNAQGELVDFTQEKPVLPAVYEGTSIPWASEEDWVVPNDPAWKVVEDNANVVDKFVSVKNTGKSDAFVRTVIAFEAGKDKIGEPYMHFVCNDNNATLWDFEWVTDENGNDVTVEIDDSVYYIGVFTYEEALKPGVTTVPNVKQVYLDKAATNEICAAYGDTFEIYALSQAVQAKGFDDAATALDTAFGKTADKAVEWFRKPPVSVSTVKGLQEALENGDNVVLTDDIALSEPLMTTEDAVIDLNGNTMTAPSGKQMFHSQSNAAPSITITSSVAGAEINVSGGDTAVLLGYGSTEIKNVTINVTGCDKDSPSPFNVYGNLTLGEGTVVNVDYLGSALIDNNGKVAISIDGAEINIGTFKRNGLMITLNNATTFEMKNTTMKIDNFVLSQFGGEGLIKITDGVTIENCTFDVTDSNGASCTFVADAGLGRYDLVQK